MMRSLWTATTGMVAMQMQIDTMSHNLANVNTIGFKKSRAEFEDLMYQTQAVAGTEIAGGDRLPTGLQVGLGVRPTTVHKFFTQGDLQNTGNQLDIAIEGDGFFRLDVNGRELYSRAGSFKLNQDGTIVSANGYVLQPEFAVPQETKNITITEGGHLACLDADGEELAGVDIPLYTFINPAGLSAEGRNLYSTTEASGDPEELNPGDQNAGILVQGFLEMSNVELVDEMVGLIVGQRAYEANSKAITTADGMLQTAVNVKR
ncbi:flagellar basal-body rod protein FlgG [Desulfovibrio sulfodismutans]|uniref:Flagellar basal-body rod protein FlgG n=1 Tax=Desulfolutivibrio sulfodismutans TaxID=63561 RepID=A0A7K3NMX2_9BACT|nr:flagellar basal-body rod protein FlgG [Desulfolutivibrio sulfodismutans]NDY57546.1 flagellar basal-body rod protein FlgG [Desulfolutivibrio sulfodismutans]QLA14326.1 flagellar basal-body rod protein FlgG [Desulfolutivibrio sulfodismutans DSM 3696]